MLSWPGRPHTASPTRACPDLRAQGEGAESLRAGARRSLMSRRPGPKPRGQALVEFAVILPILLTLFGATVDVARVYQAWNVLESATRDAAEYAATKTTTSAAALADAKRVVCAETAGLPGYQSGTPNCSSPTVTISAFSLSINAPGASQGNPIASVTVVATLPFTTFFPYPLFTQNGAWILRSTQAYSIVQGR